MIDKKKLIIIVCGIIIAATSSVLSITYIYNTAWSDYKELSELEESKISSEIIQSQGVEEINLSCENLDLKDTANCLRDNFIQPIYKYVERDERRYTKDQGSYEDIAINGGDCYDYSELYKSKAKSLGYESIIVKIKVDSDTAHVFSIMYDETGYCKLDQLSSVDCFIYSNPEDESEEKEE